MELSQVSRILGGQKVLGTRLQSRMDLVELGNRGLTKDAVAHLARHLSLSLKDMAALLQRHGGHVVAACLRCRLLCAHCLT